MMVKYRCTDQACWQAAAIPERPMGCVLQFYKSSSSSRSQPSFKL